MAEKFNLFLEKNHKWNTIINTLEGCFFNAGYVCILPGVTIAAFLKHYTDNRYLLSLPVFIATFSGSLLTFIMSFVSGRVRYKKKAVLIIGSSMRTLWLLAPVSILLFHGNGTNMLISFLIIYGLFNILMGAASIFWTEMMGRSFLQDKQGSSFGIRESVGNICGFAMSLTLVVILNKYEFPWNYAVLFLISALFMLGSVFWLSRIREAPYEVVAEEAPLNHLKNILSLPVRDVKFRWYCIFNIFINGSFFTGSLYTSTALDRFGNLIQPDKMIGIINILSVTSTAVFALVTGKIYEKGGMFKGFLLTSVFSVILPLLAIFSYNFTIYSGVFLLSGTIGVLWVLDMAAVLSMAPPERRHEYIACDSLVKMIPVLLFTNIGGLMAQEISPVAAFAAASLFCLIAFGILFFKLRILWRK